MGPGDLSTILCNLPADCDQNLLVGFNTGDDATILQITPEIAIVQSLDFFMPIVDDPFVFGMIAATNAISDIYAMGGKPISALAILGFPVKKIPLEIANQIMLGGAAICKKAGIQISGGHSIDDTEPKFGLSVTGTIHPQKILYNHTAQEGDILILTKPVGIGILGSANKKGWLSEEEYSAFVRSTTHLNDVAIAMVERFDIHAATDVTGFGLLGHALEMVQNSDLCLELHYSQLPIIPGAERLLKKGVKPGATARNLEHVAPYVWYDETLTDFEKDILADPQTSGGLLFAIPATEKEAFLLELQNQGALCYTVIGQFVKESREQGRKKICVYV